MRDTLPEHVRSAEDRFKNYTTIATMLSPTDGDYSMHSWCAHFVEVRVDEDFGTVRVSRVVSALDSGRLYNPKLAESQWKGGIIMGIGQALLEEGIVDRRYGRIVNNNLADYLIATNADIPDIEVISVGIPDLHASVARRQGGRRARHRRRRPGDRQCGLPRHRQAGARPADHAGEADLA